MDLNTVKPPVKSESNEGNIRKKDCYSSKKMGKKTEEWGKAWHWYTREGESKEYGKEVKGQKNEERKRENKKRKTRHYYKQERDERWMSSEDGDVRQ